PLAPGPRDHAGGPGDARAGATERRRACPGGDRPDGAPARRRAEDQARDVVRRCARLSLGRSCRWGGAAEATFRPLGVPAPVADAPSPVHDAAAAAYEAGRAAGLVEARAEHALLGCEIDSLLAALHAWRAEVRARYTPLAVSLAVEVARQIVGDALEARPERWTAIVAGALGRLLARERVTARMSPRL